MRMWFDRVRRMTPSDFATAFEVVMLAVWIEVALRLMPFSQLLQRVSRGPLAAPASTVAESRRLSRFVSVAYDVLPFPATCLRRSLVLCALLNRRSQRARLCLGVAKGQASLDAHAWVECDGFVSDDAPARFRELRPASLSA
jgi:hypothetical protein